MTSPCSRPASIAAAAAAAAGLALAGCGGSAADAGAGAPRAAAAAFLQRLSTGDVAGICRSLTPAATRELALDFGGSSCRATAAEAARYVAARSGLRAAVAGVRILPTLDVPLSPAPYRAGTTTTTLRLVIDDPVLGTRQALDVVLRRGGGRWRVDAGIDALFTLARARAS